MTATSVVTDPLQLAVSRAHAARTLGISVESVDRMVKRGEIATVRYSSRVMILVSELERLLTPAPAPSLTNTQAREADRQHNTTD